MSRATLSESVRASLEHATATYEKHLTSALPYLTQRGISASTARQYRLGYVAEPIRGDDDVAGRLAIPYVTTGGVVDVRYRSLNGEEPKYRSRPGSQVRLFGVTAFTQDSDTIVLCEGEIDAMTMNQIGIPAVGVPGAKQWKAHWRLLFADYDNIIVMCDGDSSGRDFGKAMAEKIDNVIVVHLPDGSDVNDYYIKHGAEALREKVGL